MIGKLNFDNEIMNFLNDTGSKISMILLHGDSTLVNEVGNFIKRDKEQTDCVTYLPKSKYKDFDTSLFDVSKSRVKIKVGRFINKFLKDKSLTELNISNKDIEDFVNLFKSYFNLNTNDLIIVEGEDIQKWYLEDNYSLSLGSKKGSLWNSCMRQSERNKFMKIYSDNKDEVKMLILLNEDGKLRSRSLLWLNVKDKEGNSYKFMDRVYSLYEHDVFLFKSWARKNGYISKWEQNAKSGRLIDVDGELKEMKLLINLPNYNQSFYPYLDTFKYFNDLNGDFSNSSTFPYSYKLIQSDGTTHREEPPMEENIEFYEDDYVIDPW